MNKKYAETDTIQNLWDKLPQSVYCETTNRYYKFIAAKSVNGELLINYTHEDLGIADKKDFLLPYPIKGTDVKDCLLRTIKCIEEKSYISK